MAKWLPTFNVLKISRMFVVEPTKKRCCDDLTKELEIPQETVRCSLRTMEDNKWLERERERVNHALSNRTARVLYRITDFGLMSARKSLSVLQLSS